MHMYEEAPLINLLWKSRACQMTKSEVGYRKHAESQLPSKDRSSLNVGLRKSSENDDLASEVGVEQVQSLKEPSLIILVPRKFP